MKEESNVTSLQQGPDERQAARQRLENLEKAQVGLLDLGRFQCAQVDNSKALVAKSKEQVLSGKQDATAFLAPTRRPSEVVTKPNTKQQSLR